MKCRATLGNLARLQAHDVCRFYLFGRYNPLCISNQNPCLDSSLGCASKSSARRGTPWGVLDMAIWDGGDWHMVCALIEKAEGMMCSNLHPNYKKIVTPRYYRCHRTFATTSVSWQAATSSPTGTAANHSSATTPSALCLPGRASILCK